jgi:hypothetical protein
MTGSSVNTQAQAAEQQNQNTAQQYAAAQQAAALANLQAYLKANPSPASTAAPIKAPTFSAPKTIGGGEYHASTAAPNMATPQATPVAGSAPTAPAQGAPGQITQLSPQLQALVAQLQAQTPAPKPSA